jgi:sodium/bile acid cotransporter 7
MQRILSKLPIDTYMLLLIATVALAIVLPASGMAAVVVSKVSYAAVALLFFIYGAKLKTRAIIDGIANWRMQSLILCTTFILFPLVGLAVALLARHLMVEDLFIGLIYVTILPSTVQSSIAFTALAKGNVPGAICAASLSNLLGVVLTPLFAMALLSTTGFVLSVNSVIAIFVQIMLPFVAGQLVRPWIGSWIERNRLLTLVVDRGSILLIVYSAFSAGMVAGVWHQIEPSASLIVIGFDVALLALVVGFILVASRMARLPRPDAISFLFCGVQKSLASGLPMASILFAGQGTSMIVLPLMLYHQIQLFVSAFIAQRYAAEEAVPAPGPELAGMPVALEDQQA